MVGLRLVFRISPGLVHGCTGLVLHWFMFGSGLVQDGFMFGSGLIHGWFMVGS